MRGGSYTRELESVIPLLELHPGDNFLDAQTEPDNLLSVTANVVTPHGRAVGVVYGERMLKKVVQRAKQDRRKLSNIRLRLGHVASLPCPDKAFSAVLYRKTRNMHYFPVVMQEAFRVTNSGARIIVCHLHWEYELPARTPENIRKAFNDLSTASFPTGVDFINEFQQQGEWRETCFDVYALTNHGRSNGGSQNGNGSSNGNGEGRYHGDWATLAREILVHEKYYTHEEVHELVEFVAKHKVAVRADRYLAVGVRH